jgi:alkylated DNA repair dioxygenase AlkB
MFMYGLRWTRKSKAKVPLNNRSYANKGLPITDAKATDGYVYDTVDQNGKTLAPVSDLQPIINEIQNAIGIDMSNYDAVIGNIYLPGQNIATHRDTTESLSARNYPVIVYTIGNNSGIGIYEDKRILEHLLLHQMLGKIYLLKMVQFIHLVWMVKVDLN